MSGVCGIVTWTPQAPDGASVDAMVDRAPHRRTGGAARHVEPNGIVVQLSRERSAEAGSRPVVDPRTGVAVVADARIDNADELRQLLGPAAPAPGNDAATLIAAAYQRWGIDALARLVGDFAVVIWDPRRSRIVLARDPLAMRGLYYRREPHRILFATEAAQILAVDGVPVRPDERNVAAYLAGCFGSMEWSYYEGVEQVAPGHAVLVTPSGARTWRYWDIDPERHVHHATLDGHAEQLRDLFLQAVQARLVGADTAGVLLSGGIDSGATAAAAGWLVEHGQASVDLYSYSWDYGSLTQCDERHISQHIIDRYQLRARDVEVEDAGPLAGYPSSAPHPDDPFHGHFQTMLDRGFARASDDGVSALFTGMRGDLAIGPVDEDYRTLLRARRLGSLAGEIARHRQVTGESTTEIIRRHVLPAALAQASRRSAARLVGRIAGRRRPSGHAGQPPWISADLAHRVGLADIIADYARSPAPALDGPLRRRRYEWIFMPMHLRWAVSHERRVATFGMQAVDAWSDRRIAEYCLAAPQQAIGPPSALHKPLARKALTGVMPDTFLRDAGKIVPTPLYHRSLRKVAGPAINELLTDSRAAAAGWVDPSPLRQAYTRFCDGGALPDEFWWAISLEWWLRTIEAHR